MPNMPCSSGPVRKEFGSKGLFIVLSCAARGSSISHPGKVPAAAGVREGKGDDLPRGFIRRSSPARSERPGRIP
ncbi:hypothetical protein MesoLjLb_11390 [Mesorhizobium sp. L-8-3]|nr:hypothetical protein MesoLjLb_11390 [Mesorhizobium sp. L-8-3]